MAEEQTGGAEVGPQKQEKTFWQKLSLWQKILIAIIILTFVFFAWTFIFGGINSIFEFAFVLIVTIVLMIVGYIVLVAGEIFFRPSYYSPKEDYFTRLSNVAIDYMPQNLNNIWFEGDIGKKAVMGGRIIGCLGIPYLIGKRKLDEKGNQAFVESELLETRVPVFEKIEYGKDGDTLFIYVKGWFIFKKTHYLRCNRLLHSTLNGDVTVYDINPVPYGKYFEYPFKQLQKDPQKIMIQSQLEVILATHEHQGDLISQSADAGIYFNPYFKLIEKTQSEISRE